MPVVATKVAEFPKGCGYLWKGFRLDDFRHTLKNLVQKDEVVCGPKNYAMCTSATFLYFVKIAKIWKEAGKITQDQFDQWTKLPGTPWTLLNNARPDLLVNTLKDKQGAALTTSIGILKSEIEQNRSLVPGDLVQLWRKDESGHSVVFQGYLRDRSDRVVGICFWSANVSTKGYGKKCEPLKDLVSLSALRFSI